MKAYIERYGNEEGEGYLALMVASEYEFHAEDRSYARWFEFDNSSNNTDAKAIEIHAFLNPVEAADELHETLEEIHGSLAARFIRGAGRALTNRNALEKLEGKEFEELLANIDKALGQASANAGNAQTATKP